MDGAVVVAVLTAMLFLGLGVLAFLFWAVWKDNQ